MGDLIRMNERHHNISARHFFHDKWLNYPAYSMFREQVNFEINYATVTRSSINPLKKGSDFCGPLTDKRTQNDCAAFFANVRKRITIFCALLEKLRFGNKGAPINQVEFDAEKLELPSNYVAFYDLF